MEKRKDKIQTMIEQKMYTGKTENQKKTQAEREIKLRKTT